MRRRLAWIGAALTLVALPSSAHAEEMVCADIYEQSQELMKPKAGASTLLPAREMLQTCMRSSCKDWVVADCSKWLSDVEARIPTVVFSARDTAGSDLTDVRVTTVDGAPVAARLDGRAIEMEPGMQTFVFITPEGVRREKQVLVREGAKSQSVAAVFDAPPDPSSPVAPGSGNERPARPAPPSKLRYAGYAGIGLGLVGLGIGSVFGVRAMSEKDNARCDSTNACDNGVALENANSAADVATVAFVAGGVFLAAGIALVVLTPSASASTIRSAQLRPSVGASGAGLELGARW